MGTEASGRRGAAGRRARVLLFLLSAVLGGSACAGHPDHRTRIKQMNRVIEAGGYDNRGRPSNDGRFREEMRAVGK